MRGSIIACSTFPKTDQKAEREGQHLQKVVVTRVVIEVVVVIIAVIIAEVTVEALKAM